MKENKGGREEVKKRRRVLSKREGSTIMKVEMVDKVGG